MSDNTDSQATEAYELINIDQILSARFHLDHITERDMRTTVWMTIRALQPTLTASDTATARLAMEVAERIDRDGTDCGVTLYGRLHSLLLDLRHVGRSAQLTENPTTIS